MTLPFLLLATAGMNAKIDDFCYIDPLVNRQKLPFIIILEWRSSLGGAQATIKCKPWFVIIVSGGSSRVVELPVIHPFSYKCDCIRCAVFITDTAAQYFNIFFHGRVIHDRINSVTETVNSHFTLWYWRWPDPQSLHFSPPEGLVPEKRTENGRFSCQHSGSRRAAATMVQYGRDLGEEPPVGCGLNEHE